jgi:hypothetical protein
VDGVGARKPKFSKIRRAGPPYYGGAPGGPSAALLCCNFARQRSLTKSSLSLASENGVLVNLASETGVNPGAGILNGIDVEEWNPETDQFLSAKHQVPDTRDPKPGTQCLKPETGYPTPDTRFFSRDSGPSQRPHRTLQ